MHIFKVSFSGQISALLILQETIKLLRVMTCNSHNSDYYKKYEAARSQEE